MKQPWVYMCSPSRSPLPPPSPPAPSRSSQCKDVNDNPICRTEKETQMHRTVFQTLWEKARAGCFKRTASRQAVSLPLVPPRHQS